MVEESPNLFQELVRKVGRYPEDAFLFVREGLGHAAEQVHGEETEAHRQLQKFLMANQMEWADLIDLHNLGKLPTELTQLITDAGGIDKLDRHVSGRQLCWGLRDYALRRWGLLARTVLESWNVRVTKDFGRIVFGFIDFNLMQKKPNDRLEDFEEVYSFVEAFDETFRPLLPGTESEESDSE